MPYGKVMVVDDVETNLYVARGLMAPYGLSIEAAASEFETIDKIKGGETFDIIFMDHYMPKMDGMETVRRIRDLGYTHPIIALTANALAGQAEMFMENGFDGLISKPVDIRQLNATLNKFIRDKYPTEVVEEARRLAVTTAKKSASEGVQSSSDAELAAIFVRDAEKTFARINAVHENAYRRKDDVRAFVIDVHAIKSALANIGETELSSAAFNLEQAGRLENLETLKAKTPGFLEALRKVIDKNKSNDDNDEAAGDYSEESFEYLKGKLLTVQKACEDYDEMTVNTALAELRQRKWPRFIKELLDTLSEHLLHSNFEEASGAVSAYINDHAGVKNGSMA
jgi:CheY-like chemotaxis protein